MKITAIGAIALFMALGSAEEVRLINLDPPEAQQYIDRQDTSLKYAPKVDANVPAVRYLGNEPHNVLEDIYLANQYHGQDGLGGYLYGYSVPDIAKTEKKKAGGDLRGAYNYIAGDGQEIKVEYWDDGTGFHQIDNVPKILPKQIEDTPEVKAAKEEHQRIWQEQAERNSRPIANPYDSHGNYAQGPLSPQGQQQFRQNQAHQLVNQYQQQKQQFPNPGQNVQYQGEQQFGQFPQQTQNVNRYQQLPNAQDQRSVDVSGQQSSGGYATGQFSGQRSAETSGQQSSGGYATGQIGGQKSAAASGQQYNGGYATGQISGQGSGGQFASGQQYSGQSVAPPQGAQSAGSYSSNSGLESGQVSGQYQQAGSQTSSQYSVKSTDDGDESSWQNEGKYNEQEEEKGPPKGFFYSFDYPVGIIVQKDGGSNQKRDLKDIYATNKAEFERQLQQGSSDRTSRSSSSYLAVQN